MKGDIIKKKYLSLAVIAAMVIVSLTGCGSQASYKASLGIPDDMSAVCMLLIGYTDTEQYDAVSSATTRNDASDVVTYIK